MSTETAITIRNATAEDTAVVTAFLHPFVEREELLPRTPDEINTLLKHGFLAELDQRVIGFAAVEIYSRKLAEIQCLAVSPEVQRRGVGRRLVEHCVRRAKEQHVLELMAISASDHFLMQCGFDYSLPHQKRALFIRPQEEL